MSRVITVPVQAGRALGLAATPVAWIAPLVRAHSAGAPTAGGTEVPLRVPVPSGSGAPFPRARS